MPPTAEVDIVQEDIWGYDSPLPLQWGRGRKDLVRFSRLEEDVVCLEENMISPYYISWQILQVLEVLKKKSKTGFFTIYYSQP